MTGRLPCLYPTFLSCFFLLLLQNGMIQWIFCCIIQSWFSFSPSFFLCPRTSKADRYKTSYSFGSSASVHIATERTKERRSNNFKLKFRARKSFRENQVSSIRLFLRHSLAAAAAASARINRISRVRLRINRIYIYLAYLEKRKGDHLDLAITKICVYLNLHNEYVFFPSFF